MSETITTTWWAVGDSMDDPDDVYWQSSEQGAVASTFGYGSRDSKAFRVDVTATVISDPSAPEPAAAEAVKRWWECHWNDTEGYHANGPFTKLNDWEEIAAMYGVNLDGTKWSKGYMESATAPTFTEFAAAVQASTGVVLPVAEEPQWWYWNGGCWLTTRICSSYVDGEYGCRVYGTKATRNQRRDALLEAAKAAGKGAGA